MQDWLELRPVKIGRVVAQMHLQTDRQTDRRGHHSTSPRYRSRRGVMTSVSRGHHARQPASAVKHSTTILPQQQFHWRQTDMTHRPHACIQHTRVLLQTCTHLARSTPLLDTTVMTSGYSKRSTGPHHLPPKICPFTSVPPWTRVSPQPNWHLGRFIRFCKTHEVVTDRETDTQTTLLL